MKILTFSIFVMISQLCFCETNYNVQIYTEPQNCVIYINDEIIGTSPIKKYELEKGVYKLKISKDNNYINFEGKLKIKEDTMLVFTLERKELTVEEKRKLLEKLIQKEDKIIIIK